MPLKALSGEHAKKARRHAETQTTHRTAHAPFASPGRRRPAHRARAPEAPRSTPPPPLPAPTSSLDHAARRSFQTCPEPSKTSLQNIRRMECARYPTHGARDSRSSDRTKATWPRGAGGERRRGSAGVRSTASSSKRRRQKKATARWSETTARCPPQFGGALQCAAARPGRWGARRGGQGQPSRERGRG